jgi:hypothetical protein
MTKYLPVFYLCTSSKAQNQSRDLFAHANSKNAVVLT